MPVSVLVVCLGNICRSPMGEAVLRHEAMKRGIDLVVDSAGTGAYHVGDDPDERTVEVCFKNRVPIEHLARKVEPQDFKTFNYILASDASNLHNLQRMTPKGSTAKIELWGSYDDGKEIGDPYYGGKRGFETVFNQCQRYSLAFLDHIANLDEAATAE